MSRALLLVVRVRRNADSAGGVCGVCVLCQCQNEVDDKSSHNTYTVVVTVSVLVAVTTVLI